MFPTEPISRHGHNRELGLLVQRLGANRAMLLLRQLQLRRSVLGIRFPNLNRWTRREHGRRYPSHIRLFTGLLSRLQQYLHMQLGPWRYLWVPLHLVPAADDLPQRMAELADSCL